LDADGRYHLALLELAAGQPGAARAEADTVLQSEPRHLLALYVAAEAERALGQPDRAAALYRRYLDAYDPDSLGSRPEYLQHQPVLPRAAEEARAFLRTMGR
ncbi:MAG TPA: tetratricopeptide repeat protein, partial [Actinomycetota bacterium]|nr:tetratricopeptide repeat protein [Actinomycetota bacterium]